MINNTFSETYEFDNDICELGILSSFSLIHKDDNDSIIDYHESQNDSSEDVSIASIIYQGDLFSTDFQDDFDSTNDNGSPVKPCV